MADLSPDVKNSVITNMNCRFRLQLKTSQTKLGVCAKLTDLRIDPTGLKIDQVGLKIDPAGLSDVLKFQLISFANVWKLLPYLKN